MLNTITGTFLSCYHSEIFSIYLPLTHSFSQPPKSQECSPSTLFDFPFRAKRDNTRDDAPIFNLKSVNVLFAFRLLVHSSSAATIISIWRIILHSSGCRHPHVPHWCPKRQRFLQGSGSEHCRTLGISSSLCDSWAALTPAPPACQVTHPSGDKQAACAPCESNSHGLIWDLPTDNLRLFCSMPVLICFITYSASSAKVSSWTLQPVTHQICCRPKCLPDPSVKVCLSEIRHVSRAVLRHLQYTNPDHPPCSPTTTKYVKCIKATTLRNSTSG